MVLLDRITADREHTYDFFYHNLGQLRLGEGWTGRKCEKPLATTLNYESILDLQQLAGQGPVRLDWDLTSQYPAGVGLSLWQLPVKGGEVYTGDTGLNNRTSRTGLTPDFAPFLIHRVRAKDEDFITVLEPHKRAARVRQIAALADAAGGGVVV